MISIGSSDARKGLGFGVGGERNMEETELEEGEACSFSKNNDDDYDDTSVDPDIALSYIDEKLQHVLGHFQKDFEGGVSAENLGAKFGGYGSFLPTYQRSPVWSHPRTSPKVQNGNTPRSPNNLQLEGGHGDSRVSSTASQLVRVGPASASAKSLPALKGPSIDGTVKKDAGVPPNYRAAESANKKACNVSDQKTLKFRIKVGSDNLSMQKNAAIYSGLGLDVSPSSSLDGSPSESDGVPHDCQDGPFESPYYIVQIMTSSPLHGSPLLSPLPDFLLHLDEREKLPNGCASLPVHRAGLGSSCKLLDGSDFLKSDGRLMRENRTKSVEKNDFSLEPEGGGKNKLARNCTEIIPKEADIDSLACEELVSNTLKLPLLSNSCSAVGDAAKGNVKAYNEEVYDSVVKDKVVSDVSKEELLQPIVAVGFVENPKVGSAGKAKEGKKTSSVVDDSVNLKKDGHRKGGKGHGLTKADSYVSKGQKPLDAEFIHHPKQKVNKKSTSLEQDGMKLPLAKELPSSGGKKKSKGSQTNGTVVAEVPKVTLRTGSLSVPKSKKSVDLEHQMKREQDEFKLEKDIAKAGDRYREFFGDIEESEKEENLLSPLNVRAENRPKDLKIVGKGTSAVNNASKEKSRGEKINKLSTSEACPNATQSGNEPILDAAPAVVTSNDNWVCCDKCQKWRLLPVGLNPEDLPEKWLCSMLYWLPGMNRCSFSEDETTKALTASNQVPAPEGQNNLIGDSGGLISGVSVADFRHPDRNHYSFGLHGMPGGGKKKHGSKEISNGTHKDGPVKFSNSVKSTQSSAGGGNLNDVGRSPLVDDPDLWQLSNPGDLFMERHKHKQKEKHIRHGSDGGDIKNPKIKSKRDPEEECLRAFKKMKTKDLRFTGEDWMPDQGGAMGKVGPSSSSGLPSTSAGKERPKYNGRSSSKDSKNDAKDRMQISTKTPKDKVQVSLDEGSLSRGNSENRSLTKKRKQKESQDTQTYLGSLPDTGHPFQDGQVCMKEEFSESVHRKEKKARASKSEGKESSASKGSGRTEKKGSHSKDRQRGKDLGSTLSHRSLDGLDSLKKDSSSVQPVVAATSSSSKVSGSHKSKARFHESKGSPVESVSSSPMRLANPDKLASARRNLTEKDDSHDVGFFVIGSPRRCSDGEDDGGSDRSGTARKENTSTMAHESSALDFQDKDCIQLPGIKDKAQTVPSPDTTGRHFTNGGENYLGRDSQHPSRLTTSDLCHDEERLNGNLHQDSRTMKFGKGSSVRSKDKNRNFKSESDLGKIKTFDCGDELQDRGPPCEVRPRDGKNKFQEKFEVKSNEIVNKFAGKKEFRGKFSSDIGQRGAQSMPPDVSSVKVDTSCGQDLMSTPKKNLQQECNGERSSKKSLSDKTDQAGSVSGRDNSVPLPPSGAQNETLACCPRPVSGPHKANGVDILANNSCEGNEASKMTKQKKVDDQNGTQHISARHTTGHGHKSRDVDARSPLRKDSSSQAASSVMKEAKDLKHRADRFKNSGLIHESNGIYFQAALKFLHGASLLESSCSESAKQGELIQMLQTYSSTAKLCEYCAHEYEKSKDMAAAALAYKCMEVAYMRVIYNSHSSASRDRQELQTALQMVPPGESPSSSASDVDNLNHPMTVDKVPVPKGVSSPQVAGHHVIAARNRSNLVRLLNYSQDVHFAMEASKKSQIAFAAANISLGEAQRGEGISSIKRALDFNFHDVEGLLRLVKLAMEAISR